MGIALGLLVALTYGSADFFGGMASRQVRPWGVVAASRIVGLLFVLVVALALDPHLPPGNVVLIGLLAGLVNVSGTFLLYKGLSVGAMGVDAAVSAVTTAVIPAVWGLVEGEHLSIQVSFGIVLALAAIALMGSTGHHGRHPGGVGSGRG